MKYIIYFRNNFLLGFDAPTVWSEFTPLSQKHKSVNLGQGFPDWETPQFVKQAFIDVSFSKNFSLISLSLIHLVRPLTTTTINTAEVLVIFHW